MVSKLLTSIKLSAEDDVLPRPLCHVLLPLNTPESNEFSVHGTSLELVKLHLRYIWLAHSHSQNDFRINSVPVSEIYYILLQMDRCH